MYLRIPKSGLEKALSRISTVAGNTEKSRITLDGSGAVFTQSGSLYCAVPLPLTEVSDPAPFEIPLKPFLAIVQHAEEGEDIRLRLSQGSCRVAQAQFDLGLPAIQRDGYIPVVEGGRELPVAPSQLAESFRFALSFTQDTSGYIEYSVAEVDSGILYAYDGVKACARTVLEDDVSFPIQFSALSALERFFRSSPEPLAYFKETDNLRSFSDGKAWVAFRKDRRSVSENIKTYLTNVGASGCSLTLPSLLRSLKRLTCVLNGPDRKLKIEARETLKLSIRASVGILSVEEVYLTQAVKPFSATLDLKEFHVAIVALDRIGARDLKVEDCSDRGYLKISSPEAQTFVGVLRA